MKIFRILPIAACILYFSCSSSPSGVSPDNHYAFELHLKDNQQKIITKFDQFFSSGQIVPLRFRDSTKLASISKLVVYGSRYFVLDRNFSQLYSFDSTGNEIVKYGDVGLKPGEYKKISDFDIAGDQLLILSNNDRAINFYNINTGKFIKRQKMDSFGYSIATCNTGEALIYLNQNVKDKDHLENVLLIDSSASVIFKYFPVNQKNRSLGITFTGFLTKTDNQVYYTPPFGDKIYLYKDKIFKKYIDFGINSSYVNANMDNLQNMFKETVLRDPKTSFLESSFFKNDRYVVAGYQDSLHINYCFYDIKSQSTTIFKKSKLTDPSLMLIDGPEYLTGDNQMIFSISPGTVYYLKTSLPEMYKKLRPQDRMILDNIAKDSNPLLFICKLK